MTALAVELGNVLYPRQFHPEGIYMNCTIQMKNGRLLTLRGYCTPEQVQQAMDACMGRHNG